MTSSSFTSPMPADQTEEVIENSIRPKRLGDFVGQGEIRANLEVFIQSALKRGKPLDHTVFYGPPGLGKTTLANILANEMGATMRSTSGPILSKAADLVAIVTSIRPGDVVFIDEIHRLPMPVEEVLYSALEDFKIDIMIGEGPAARSIKIDLPPFTLVGATTRMGMLSNPLRSRFGILLPLQFYEIDDLARIVSGYCMKNAIPIAQEASVAIAKISRRTPRIALRVVRRVVDFCVVSGGGLITEEIVADAAKNLGIDGLGLDKDDITYLRFIADKYAGGPVGIDTIIAGTSGDRRSIEEMVEPFLLQEGLVSKTSRGRVLTKRALEHLGLDIEAPQ